jgi:hypothetical protein
MNTIENYIHTKQINLNTPVMIETCDYMMSHIQKVWGEEEMTYSGQSTMTTGLYSYYNLLLYPYGQLYELYREIVTLFKEVAEKDNVDLEKNPYYIQCWLNFYRKGEFIDWHGHWNHVNKEIPPYHGFYCVTGEGSKTTYKLGHAKEWIDIPTIENQIVISKSTSDMHRTWPWEGDKPRITIAFDIVSRSQITGSGARGEKYPSVSCGAHQISDNHWIPINNGK